ncbi:MAG TPA: tetratricopeptide repeat protein [Xanthomonadales bacterium]|nr:tetratricopeptide repeat protein [Xanthomonadales bacterium]
MICTAILAAIGSGLVACATTPAPQPAATTTPVASGQISAKAVITSSPLQQAGLEEGLFEVDMLALSPEMLAFIDEYVERDVGESERLAQLLYAVLGGDRFQLEYDDTTGTAISTFNHGGGNCISFTNMFIAMARNLGLDASYQEVEIPPDWTVSGNTWLISEHINVLVDVKNALSRVVDFNSYSTIVDVETQSRVVSDARARAHYFNNIGVERMLDNQVGLAYANLQHSISEDPTFASSWVNMGILHRREGFEDYAEAAYLEAIRHDRGNLMAMSNLADLYQQEGREEEAKRYLSRVREHRMSNPFYRFRLADIAFNDGDYKSAIKNLKYAIRQKNDEDQFYYLLSLSYLMAGDKQEAQRWMKEAQEVARATKDKKRYSRKLELLMGKDTS